MKFTKMYFILDFNKTFEYYYTPNRNDWRFITIKVLFIHQLMQ